MSRLGRVSRAGEEAMLDFWRWKYCLRRMRMPLLERSFSSATCTAGPKSAISQCLSFLQQLHATWTCAFSLGNQAPTRTSHWAQWCSSNNWNSDRFKQQELKTIGRIQTSLTSTICGLPALGSV